MKRPGRRAVILGVVWAMVAGTAWGGELEEYIRRDDPSFSWTSTRVRREGGGTIAELALVSQTWQGIRWEHRLRVHEAPAPSYPDAMLLFITGGSTDSRPGPEDDALGLALARS